MSARSPSVCLPPKDATIVPHTIMFVVGKISFDKSPYSEDYFAPFLYTRKTPTSRYPEDHSRSQDTDDSYFKNSVFLHLQLMSSDPTLLTDKFPLDDEKHGGILQQIQEESLKYLNTPEQFYGVIFKLPNSIFKKFPSKK